MKIIVEQPSPPPRRGGPVPPQRRGGPVPPQRRGGPVPPQRGGGPVPPPLPNTTNPPVATEQNPGGGGKQYRIPGDPWRWTIGADGGWWAKRDTDTVWRNVSVGAETTNPNWKKSVNAMDKAFFGGDSDARKSAKDQTGDPLPSFVRRQRAETIDEIKTGKKFVYKGSKGDVVTKIQEMLNKIAATYGYDVIEVDNKFGSDTDKAVKSFQKEHGGLKVDGVVGKSTIEALEKVIDRIKPSESPKPETPISGPEAPVDSHTEPITPETEPIKPEDNSDKSSENVGTPVEGERKIRGTVTDEKNTPLPGVYVLLLGTSDIVISDADGKYSIDVDSKNNNNRLMFSMVGYESKTLEVGSGNTLDVKLKLEKEKTKKETKKEKRINKRIEKLKQKLNKNSTLSEIFGD